MNLTGIPIWLINLDRSYKRRSVMEQRLDQLGLCYRRFSAIDGKKEWDELEQSVDLAGFRRNVGRDILKGEIGASHSHFGVWRELSVSGAEIGLVLEDDVVFHEDFLRGVDAALALKDHWDLLKLNCVRAKLPICQGTYFDWRINAYLGPATGLGAYLVRRDLVQRLLPVFLPIRRPIDRELDRIHIHRFRHLGLEPFPTHVDDEDLSTITGLAYAEVKKFHWYRRIPDYWERLVTSTGKAAWLLYSGQLLTGLSRFKFPR